MRVGSEVDFEPRLGVAEVRRSSQLPRTGSAYGAILSLSLSLSLPSSAAIYRRLLRRAFRHRYTRARAKCEIIREQEAASCHLPRDVEGMKRVGVETRGKRRGGTPSTVSMPRRLNGDLG